MAEWDYIIVGAGSAGCVLAERLSLDPSVSVLVLEGGPADRNPFIHMPRGIPKIMFDPRWSYGFMTEPETGNNQTPERWARGKTLGGSSSINGMVYNRGQPADYEAIARLAGEEWGWQHIARAYKVDRELGTLERGKIADLVMLDANPLESARNYRRINAVIKDGKVVDLGALPVAPVISRLKAKS